MIHAQRDFIPHMSGLSDYYFPGEQYGAMVRRNPFGYTDEVPDIIYRSEFNRDVLGVGVIHLPALGQVGSVMYKPESYKYTEAMLCMLMSHDIETAQYYAAAKPLHRAWDVLKRYGVDSPSTVCRLYHEQNEVTSSSPDVRVTYYACPNGRHLLILANKDVHAHDAVIDVSRLGGGDLAAREEYCGQPLKVEGGQFAIRVPARSFRMVATPPIPEFPVRDSMEKVWSSWQNDKCDTQFSHSMTGGTGDSACLKMDIRETGGGCFLRPFRITAGCTYAWRVMARQERAAEGSHVSLSVQGRKGGRLLGIQPVTSRLPASSGWQMLELKFTIPKEGKWLECDEALVTMGGTGRRCTIFFDDFEMDLLSEKGQPDKAAP